MQANSVYINLPISDIEKTKNFWTNLGFSFNLEFSDEKALCLEIKTGSIYAMLISKEYFSTFTNKPISDNSTTQVLIAIEVENRKAVDEIISNALSSGGSRYQEPKDHDWMYYDTFSDIDGHQWEILSYNK